MKKLLFLITLCGLAHAQQVDDGFNWNTIKLSNQEFVSMVKIRDFYGLNEIERKGEKLTLSKGHIEIVFTLSSHCVSINGVKFLTAHHIKSKGTDLFLSIHDLRSLIDPVLRPKFRPRFKNLTTVILDAGHGGHDLGAADNEAQLTLSLAFKIKALLEKQGLKVVMTRDKNEWVSLNDRVRTANANKKAIVVSLHFNSGNKNAKGFESYIMGAQKRIPESNSSNIALASAVHSNALQSIGAKTIKDRAIRRAKFTLLQRSENPIVLIEAGFLTNTEEAAIISTEDYQTKLAEGISRGIEDYRISLQK